MQINKYHHCLSSPTVVVDPDERTNERPYFYDPMILPIPIPLVPVIYSGKQTVKPIKISI